jgi:hypothetical protein
VISGVHILLYSRDPEADRIFFRDVLEFPAIDIGHGWLIFAMPPAEAAVHPTGGATSQTHGGRDLLGAVVYFMCDDLHSYMQTLKSKNVECTAIENERWGMKTTIRLPSGGEIGLYQPSHPTALNLD